MKGEKWLTCLLSALMGFALSVASVGCIVTAFVVEFNWSAALWVLAAASVVGGVCYTRKLGLVPLAVLALLTGFFWRRGVLMTSVMALLRHVSLFYNSAYGWGVFPASTGTPQFALCAIGILVSLSVNWTVCRRKSSFWALLAVLLTVVCCFVVTDTVPALWCIGLVLWGACLLLIGQSTRRRGEKDGNRLFIMAAVPLALCVSILLAAVPRETYQGRARAERLQMYVRDWFNDLRGLGGQVYPGTVELKDVGPQNLPKIPVMQVTATGKNGTVYLRGRAYDLYGGNNWNDSGAVDQLYWPTQSQLDKDGVYTLEIQTRRAETVRYYPYYVLSQYVPSYIGNQDKATRYEYQVQDLKDPVTVYQYTEQVVAGFCVKLPALLEMWADRYLTEAIPGFWGMPPEEQVEAIAGHVRGSAVYSLQTPRMQAERLDFVQWFLEESDTGYCVHFATAAAVLMRAAGIPARYVTGYMVNVKDGTPATVYESDAHAWVEYWEPGVGWKILEATPGTGVSRPEEEEDTRPAQTAPAQTRPTQPQTQTQQKDKLPVGVKTVLIVLAVCAGLAIGLVIQWRIRRYLRRKKLTQGTTNLRAVACWRETVLLARLLEERPDRALFDLAQKAKYSPHVLTEGELEPFTAYITNSRERLKTHPVWMRVLYGLIWAAL